LQLPKSLWLNQKLELWLSVLGFEFFIFTPHLLAAGTVALQFVLISDPLNYFGPLWII